MIDPNALREIAGELDVAQVRAQEQLRELLNGSLRSEGIRTSENGGIDSSGEENSGLTDIGPRPTVDPSPPAIDQEPEVLPGARAAHQASGSADRPPLRCAKCGREFPKGTGIRTHERWCTGTLASAQDRSASKVQPFRAHPHRSFLCRYCNRPFEKLPDLAAHELTHPAAPKGQPLGDRPMVKVPGGDG